MITLYLRDFLITRPFVPGLVEADNVVKAPASLEQLEFQILTFDQADSITENDVGGNVIDLVKATVRYVCAGKSPAKSLELAQAVKDDLGGFKGLIGPRFCVSSQFGALVDGYDDDTDAHLVVVNHIIWHRPE